MVSVIVCQDVINNDTLEFMRYNELLMPYYPFSGGMSVSFGGGY
jgi:hypothetical protein